MAAETPTMNVVSAVLDLLRKAREANHNWPTLLLGSDAWAQWTEVVYALTPEQQAELSALPATLLHEPKARPDSITLLARPERYVDRLRTRKVVP